MPFLSTLPDIRAEHPMMALVLGNTMLSTIPGLSGAGPSPEKTLLTPILDAELVADGTISSMPIKPNTPTGCPTPATITRSMTALVGIPPLFINAGLAYPPTVPCMDVYGQPGGDPRISDAVPSARELYRKGEVIGRLLSRYSDLLVLGECVPGGTTTALIVLRALGYGASVSSSFVKNPTALKESICREVIERINNTGVSDPLDIIRMGGDPMMPVAAGIANSYDGTLFLAGGTQMLAVVAAIKALGGRLPHIATTVYVRDDPSADFPRTLREIGTEAYYLDPGFAGTGHAGLARYCIGEVKEGMGAGGAILLAHLMGFSGDEITRTIVEFVCGYT